MLHLKRYATSLLHSKKVRKLGSAAAAFIAYGAWAFYANYAHDFPVRLKATMTHGSYSFVITLCLACMMEFIYRTIRVRALKFPVTFVLTCLVLYITSWSINALLGTPEILMTILPGTIIASIYTFFYISILSKLNRAGTSIAPESIN